MISSSPDSPFRAAPFIKEIGRGKKGARSISRADAFQLYAAMLDGRVSDLEMGGLMLAMRIKGESVDEIAGFLDAAEASIEKFPMPAGDYAPVVIPSYNGSRQLPNLTPLLALLLTREGVPVFVHGVLTDPGRTTTAEIFQQLNLPLASTVDDVTAGFAQRYPVFMPIQSLAPKLTRLLDMRRILGVRNSTHTLVKMIQPFSGPALRITPYTHPEYLTMLTTYFSTAAPPERGDVFLMRGTEGEAVANAKRAQQIEWFHRNTPQTIVEKQEPVDELPPLPPANDASTTAEWIRQALQDEQLIPASIAAQVQHCLSVSGELQKERPSASSSH